MATSQMWEHWFARDLMWNDSSLKRKKLCTLTIFEMSESSKFDRPGALEGDAEKPSRHEKEGHLPILSCVFIV